MEAVTLIPRVGCAAA